MQLFLPLTNLYTHLSTLADGKKKNPALFQYDKESKLQQTISWEKLVNKVSAIASWLSELNVQEGDVIAIAMENSPELLMVSWAAWAIGVITSPLDVKKDTLQDHLYKIKLIKPKFIVTQKNIFTDKEKIFLTSSLIELPTISKKFSSKTNWKKNINHQALILFTSGTTAHPKGVQLSLENLIANADGIKEWFQIKKDDRFMLNLPLHHINSTTFCLATLLAGGSIAIFPRYSNSKFWQQAAISSSTFSSIVASICFDQLSRKKEYDSVKNKLKLNRIQIGSAPVVVSDVKKFMQLFKIPLFQGYGQTETALRVTGVPLDLKQKLYQQLVDTNSIGKTMKWATVEIMDEKGKIVGEGKEGEVVVKGPVVMKGYLGLKEGFKNGYFRTGDIGYFKKINGEKYFFLKGRKKEIIIKGGINISPVAIENKLKQISPNIDQVYAIGIPDKRYGEEIGAVICWKKKDVVKANIILKEKLLAGSTDISDYETPQYLATINQKDLPLTSTGKVQRSILKKNIPSASFEPIDLIVANRNYRFFRLSLKSPYIKEAFALYNYAWDPLTTDMKTFRDQIRQTIIIIALDKDNKVQGLICTIQTNLSQKELCSITYADLVGNKRVLDSQGKALICVAICSSNYRQEPIPQVKKIPTSSQMQAYLESGRDSVLGFHAKPKGGFTKGAALVCLLPNARPEDERSLGYNMLLKYPQITQEIKLKEGASVAVQLIEVVMLLARSLGVEDVYAFSRPAGAAGYFVEKQ